jgi:enoyl-CoA hydratase/carnithine racemase
MSDAEVLCDIRNGVAILTLNRPSALNALTLEMIGELRSRLRACALDPAVRAVLMRGQGDKAFCAGGDIRALYQSLTESGSLHHEFFIAEYSLDYALYSYAKPYIALMDGITMGGGMGLAQGASLRIVGDRTRIAMPEVAIGIFPDVGASYFLSRLPGSLGPYLALTGTQIRGADALYCQLADVYLPAAAVASLGESLEGLNWSEDPRSDLIRLIHAQSAQGLAAPSLSVLRPAIDAHFSQASISAIVASLERETRGDYADWAQQTIKLLHARSPTMLAVTLRQLQRGKGMALADCFRMELGMMQQCFVHGDFVEGTRALIIDKDNTPHWTPSRIHDVTEEMIERFFNQHWPAGAHPLAILETQL